MQDKWGSTRMLVQDFFDKPGITVESFSTIPEAEESKEAFMTTFPKHRIPHSDSLKAVTIRGEWWMGRKNRSNNLGV